MIVVYTDGSSLGNPGKAGAATLITRDGLAEAYASLPLAWATNNVAELEAACVGLRYAALFHGIWPDDRIILAADSKYVLNGIRRCDIWRDPGLNRPNADLWGKCHDALAAVGAVVGLYWIHGHKGISGNEWCDTLAREAANTQKERKWSRMKIQC